MCHKDLWVLDLQADVASNSWLRSLELLPPRIPLQNDVRRLHCRIDFPRGRREEDEPSAGARPLEDDRVHEQAFVADAVDGVRAQGRKLVPVEDYRDPQVVRVRREQREDLVELALRAIADVA